MFQGIPMKYHWRSIPWSNFKFGTYSRCIFSWWFTFHVSIIKALRSLTLKRPVISNLSLLWNHFWGVVGAYCRTHFDIKIKANKTFHMAKKLLKIRQKNFDWNQKEMEKLELGLPKRFKWESIWKACGIGPFAYLVLGRLLLLLLCVCCLMGKGMKKACSCHPCERQVAVSRVDIS